MKKFIIALIFLILPLLEAQKNSASLHQSGPREIDVVITSDFPVGEFIEPEIVALNGKDARDNLFKPGKYQLEIKLSGYAPLNEGLLIPPGEQPFRLERILISKPRLLKEKITYDVKPPENLAPYKITMAPLEKPKAEKIVKAGDMIKPGAYILRITKEAYEPVETKKYVWPAVPLVLENQLIAKQVEVQANIVYDIEPPPHLEGYKLSLINKEMGIPCHVSYSNKIKPGAYFLDIQRPGYNFGPPQEVEIFPSEQPYHITKKLFAKSRRISLAIVDQGTNTMVPAYQILANGKPVDDQQTFLPGSELRLIFKFDKYKTVKKRTNIIPGEGPFVEHLPLVALKKYDLSIKKPYRVIDAIKYNYEFYADSEKIADHQIKIEKNGDRYYFRIWADPQAKILKVGAGYRFVQRPFEKIQLGIGPMTGIDVAKLIEHLERKSIEGHGHRQALEIMEKKLSNGRERHCLKNTTATALDRLRRYIENWKDLREPGEQARIKSMIAHLEKLKK